MKIAFRAVLCATLILAFALPCAAAENRALGFHGWGPHAGFSFTPDQFFFGGHLDLGDFIPNLQFRPSVDLGIGDHLTLFTVNPDVIYNFPLDGTGTIYGGGIFAFQYYKIDNVPDGFDDSDTSVGIHLLGGYAMQDMPVHFQAEVGLNDDAPDWKFSAGYTFKH